jgi:hypothetical protein
MHQSPSRVSKKTASVSLKRGKRTDGKRAKGAAVWYDIAYPASAYTFPKEAVINQVCFDDKYLRFELTDGRNLEIPLSWIPTLYNAEPEEIAKYEITRDRRMIIWDPDKCAINDEVRVQDYLGPCRKED